MSITSLDQYRELCQDCRNREAHAWLIPGGSFVWTATLLSSIADASGLTRVLLSFLNALVYSSLLLLFYRWSRYQAVAQEGIKKLLGKAQFADFANTPQFFGLPGWSSTKYLIFVMFVILLIDVIIFGVSFIGVI